MTVTGVGGMLVEAGPAAEAGASGAGHEVAAAATGSAAAPVVG